MDIVTNRVIKVYKNREFIDKQDIVIVETNLNIYINNYYYTSLMALPKDIEELIIGFLFTDGVIDSYTEIEKIKIADNNVYVNLIDLNRQIKRKETAITSGCGRGSLHISMLSENNLPKVYSDNIYNADTILNCVMDFNKSSNLFLETGGVHSAALCDEKLIVKIDDIGRHNAIDKIIGHALKNNLSFSNKFILTSGRISSEMLIKSAKARVPVIVSHSAPTNLSIDLARMCNITLVGFARGNRFNIYSGFERIK